MSGDDERLRNLLRDAHRDDAPPPFARLADAEAAARPRRRRRFALALAPLAALALVLVFVFARPPRPQPIDPNWPERLRVEWNDPLAFLLAPAGRDDVLTSVPRFELPGELQ